MTPEVPEGGCPHHHHLAEEGTDHQGGWSASAKLLRQDILAGEMEDQDPGVPDSKSCPQTSLLHDCSDDVWNSGDGADYSPECLMSLFDSSVDRYVDRKI